jgi:hypothetical protein
MAVLLHSLISQVADQRIRQHLNPHNNDAGTIKSAKSGFRRCEKTVSVATHTDMGCLTF